MRNRVIALAVFVALLILVAVLAPRFDPRYLAAAHLADELRGKLTAAERALEAPDLDAGIPGSAIEEPAQLATEEDVLVKAGDAPSTATLRKRTGTHVDAISTATLREAQKSRGTGTLTCPAKAADADAPTGMVYPPGIAPIPGVICPAAGCPANDIAPIPLATCPTAGCPANDMPQLDWWDEWHRFHFVAPNVNTPDTATLEADQHFRLTAVVLRENTGDLRTEQVTLQETTADGSKVLGVAKLLSAELHYAPDAPVPERIWDPHLIAELGAVVRIAPVGVSASVGVGATLLQWRGFGVAAVGYLDFRSLAGSGAAAELFWRPSVLGRPLNLAVGAGVGLGLDLQAHPYVGVCFVVL